MVGIDLPGRGQHGFCLCALFLCAFWNQGDDYCGAAIPRAADYAGYRHRPSWRDCYNDESARGWTHLGWGRLG